MLRRHLTATATAVALAFAGATATRAACRPTTVATVPLRLEGNAAVVDVALGGTVAPMLLDTGAERTMVTTRAVAAYHLPLDAWVGTVMRGAGGQLEERRDAAVRTVALGDVVLRRRGLSQQASLPVTAQDLGGSPPVAGLLGSDYLGSYDLDLDLAGGTLRLMDATGCAGRFLPWAGAYDAIPARPVPPRGTLLVPVTIDGHRLAANLDTGAGTSFVNARGMHALGLDAAALSADPGGRATAVGGTLELRRHVFSALQLGALRVERPALTVATVPQSGYDMLLGMDLLRGRRVWISYATAQVFIQAGPDDRK